MFALLFLLFLGMPVLEIWVILQVGGAIGAGWTVLLLLGDSIVGAWLMRSQGRIVWRRFTTALAEGGVPAREVVDGALVVFGGALQLTPGFVTDGIGLLCVLPPSRAVIRRALAARIQRRGAIRLAGWATGRPRGGGAGRPAPSYDVEGSASEAREEDRHLP